MKYFPLVGSSINIINYLEKNEFSIIVMSETCQQNYEEFMFTTMKLHRNPFSRQMTLQSNFSHAHHSCISSILWLGGFDK